MKFFFCLLNCLVALSMSGADTTTEEDILFKTGAYSPVAAVDGWRKFLEKEQQYVDAPGLPHHKKLLDATKQVEEILIKNDQANTLKLFDELVGYAEQLLPHIKNELAKKIHSEIVADAKKLIADGAANKLGKDDLYNFIRKAYKGVSVF